MTHPLTPRGKVELKPCPFCGGEAEMFSMSDRIGVRCADVMCAGSHRLPAAGEDSVALWNRRTALASGSGDHAELARLAESLMEDARRVADMPRNEKRDEQAGYSALASVALTSLLAENAALRGDRDRIAEELHGEINYAAEQSVNALEAERKLAEAVSVMDQIREAASISKARDLARTFLSKEAERG